MAFEQIKAHDEKLSLDIVSEDEHFAKEYVMDALNSSHHYVLYAMEHTKGPLCITCVRRNGIIGRVHCRTRKV